MLLLSSCSGPMPQVTVSPQRQPDIRRIAVLPLLNESQAAAAQRIATRTLITETIAFPGIKAVNPADVKHYMRRMRYYPRDMFDAGSPILSKMAAYLQADAFIRGKVFTFNQEARDRQGSLPQVSLQLELINPQGEIITQTFYQQSGDAYRTLMHYGVLRSRTALVARMYQEIFSNWQTEGLLPQQVSKEAS